MFVHETCVQMFIHSYTNIFPPTIQLFVHEYDAQMHASSYVKGYSRAVSGATKFAPSELRRALECPALMFPLAGNLRLLCFLCRPHYSPECRRRFMANGSAAREKERTMAIKRPVTRRREGVKKREREREGGRKSEVGSGSEGGEGGLQRRGWQHARPR
jgi:hypothetical protein